MRQFAALVLITVLVTPAGAFAQQTGQTGQSQEPPPANAQSVDPTKLGVDLARIKRELAQAEESEASDSPLRLRFTIQVLGMAPKIDLLEGFNVSGPIPYGAPTHQEFLDVVTPKEYRSPVVPIFGLAVAAAQKLMQYSKKQQCQAEIEEYRRLVMQGVAVAAPRCNQ